MLLRLQLQVKRRLPMDTSFDSHHGDGQGDYEGGLHTMVCSGDQIIAVAKWRVDPAVRRLAL